jgi:hypothetical protein
MEKIELSMHGKIENYVSWIKAHPNKAVRYFTFDDGKKFIVSGDRLKLMPLEYDKFRSKDGFWVHVDIDIKTVMYYAFDIEDYTTGKHINDEEGFFDWDKVEEPIYNFLVLNIDDLATLKINHGKALSTTTEQFCEIPRRSSISDYTKPINAYTPPAYTPPNYNSHNYYGSPEYKAREAFYDKLNAFLKQNNTVYAIDFINENIETMCKEKKFSEIDTWLNFMVFDKLNVPAMLGILRATNNIDNVLKNRKDFFEKVQRFLIKIKPGLVDNLLKDLAPGKPQELVASN